MGSERLMRVRVSEVPVNVSSPEGREPMRQAYRKALATVMLSGGVLTVAGHAHADSNAEGGAAGSPGVLAGNAAQVPVNVPVMACGNTVNVVGLLNPAMGNSCAHASHSAPHKPSAQPQPHPHKPSEQPHPHKPSEQPHPHKPSEQPRPHKQGVPIAAPDKGAPAERPAEQPAERPADPVTRLAETGSAPIALALPSGAALLLAGVVLYRRPRRSRRSSIQEPGPGPTG
jgi:hypothetical protein